MAKGDNFKNLIASVAGVDSFDEVTNENFDQGLDALDVSKRGRRRVNRGLKRFRKADADNRDFILGDDTFEARDDEGRLAGSGPRRGNQVGFQAGDLVGAGNSLSYLAGALQKQRGVVDDRRLAQVNNTRIDDFETIETPEFDINSTIDDDVAGPPRPSDGDGGGDGSGRTPPVIEEDETETEAASDLDLNRFSFPIRDNSSPTGFRHVTRFSRPTIIEQNRGPLALQNPELFQEYLDDDANGAVTDLILDQEFGRSGDISPQEYDERFRQWVKATQFDEGVGRQAILGRGKTFDALNEVAPARRANALDFQDTSSNFADLIGAAELVGGVEVARGTVRTVKGIKDAIGATKIATNAFKSADEIAGVVTKSGRSGSEQAGFNLAKGFDKFKAKAKDLLNIGKNKVDDVVAKVKPKKTTQTEVLKGGNKPTPKVETPKTVETPAVTNVQAITKQPIGKVMQNPAMKKSFTPEKLTEEINAFIAKNPAAQQMSLSNGSRIKLVKGSWKLFASGGKIKASNLL